MLYKGSKASSSYAAFDEAERAVSDCILTDFTTILIAHCFFFQLVDE